MSGLTEMRETREIHLIGAGDGAQQPSASASTMGGKAWNLLCMARMGLPVPPAFVLGTPWCADAQSRQLAASPQTWHDALQALAQSCGRGFGDVRRPLLLSVRSGAPVSMPGMMETLLNIGLCERTLPGLIRLSGDPRLAWDAYRRLIASYGEVVAGIDAQHFEQPLQALCGSGDERELDFAQLRGLAKQHLQCYEQLTGQAFPQDPLVQLSGAIAAVFASWDAPKACAYRAQHGLDAGMGTAVTVQRMVFGNAGTRSGAGVGFTRDPITGEPGLWVDFLFKAQGEDVVSGRRVAHGHEALAERLPSAWRALQAAAASLERGMGDMQDLEFTVEDGTLFMLQTRSGKRTPRAAARIALDLLDEGCISAATARERLAELDPASLSVSEVCAAGGDLPQPVATGACACAGVVSGGVVFDEAQARQRQAKGLPSILVTRDAQTRDVAAMALVSGVLTANGARTSHAAVVARQMGKVCLVGCPQLVFDDQAQQVSLAGAPLLAGDTISLDGNRGQVYRGALSVREDVPQALLARMHALLHGKDV